MANWMQWLETIKPYAEVGGEIASGIAKNRAAGRQAENAASTVSDQQNLNRYAQEELAKLAAAKLTEESTQDRADRYLESGRTRAGQAAFGDALANMRGIDIQGVPDYIPQIRFGGGLSPDVFGPNARAAGQTLSRDALAAMMSGADVPDLPDVSGIGQSAPEATPPAEANWFDKALEYGSYAGAGAGAVGEVQRRRREDREKREAASRPPLPAVKELGYIPAVGYQPPAPPAPGDYRVNTLELLAKMKAEEDAARARGTK